jgi:hypothetical protein
VIEAYKPITMEPAYGEWEPLLGRHGYFSAWDDELNRYYVAQEARALGARLATGPLSYPDIAKVSSLKPAAEDENHPDHRLAHLLVGADLAKLPLVEPETLLGLLTAGLPPEALAASATEGGIAAIFSRLFGSPPDLPEIGGPPGPASIRDIYLRVIDSDRFRAACGRICASYAW